LKASFHLDCCLEIRHKNPGLVLYRPRQIQILKCILSVKLYSFDRPDLFDALEDLVLFDRIVVPDDLDELVDLVELDDLFTGVVDLEREGIDLEIPEDLEFELLL